MEKIDGIWYMKGKDFHDPKRIKSVEEVEDLVNKLGFLPFFANSIPGFSLEEQVCPDFWWTGSKTQDPWEWREIIARSHKLAYGKFFDKKAGFISMEFLPFFTNARREGYDFDARWADGKASRREKMIMDYYMDEDDNGDIIWSNEKILSTDLKKATGFGKGGAKNFPGIVTNLQMETYLVIADFKRKLNKEGKEYGMPVSILMPPESIWGYEHVTSAYNEEPKKSWERIYNRLKENFPEAKDSDIKKLILKMAD